MEQAHEGFIWSLSWHPLGHILCSGSNDHTRYDWAQCSGHPLFKAESLMLLFFCPSASSGVEIDQEKS